MKNVFILIALCALAASAQINSFPKPNYFRETFAKPVMHVELRPPVRLADYVVAGKDGKKLELSLHSYLDLVMANNTDISVSRLAVQTSQNAITRAFAPFDPLATARWTTTRSTTPASDALQGASTLQTLQQPANFQWQQLLPSGTQYNVQFFGQKISTNSGFQNFNPALNASLAVNFTQPLLKNRGTYVNRLFIMSARSQLRVTEYNLKDRVIGLIGDAENAYWDVVLARETLRVQESALDLANQALTRARQELNLGAMSPLDIFNPEQQVATAEIGVSQARYTLLQREDALRRQMGADLDPSIRLLPIALTETVSLPGEAPPVNADTEIDRALRSRQDLKAVNQSLDVDDLGIKVASNNLRPDLSLVGGYTSQGRGGIFTPRQNFIDPGLSIGNVSPVPGGFNDALGQLFGFGYPIYYAGLQLRMPIRNRAAAADLADAMVTKKRDALQVRNTEQTIRLDILNAVNAIESSKASIKLSKVALDFSNKYLDAEKKKYELGTSTIFFVLQAQTAVVNAESAVVQNTIAYRRNLLNLSRRTGELLEERGVAIQ
ncbi:MAG: TolC family protein [Acidobacteriota bacterium]|nr:TolC family protein [Acidobacteriota bacterium]